MHKGSKAIFKDKAMVQLVQQYKEGSSFILTISGLPNNHSIMETSTQYTQAEATRHRPTWLSKSVNFIAKRLWPELPYHSAKLNSVEVIRANDLNRWILNLAYSFFDKYFTLVGQQAPLINWHRLPTTLQNSPSDLQCTITSDCLLGADSVKAFPALARWVALVNMGELFQYTSDLFGINNQAEAEAQAESEEQYFGDHNHEINDCQHLRILRLKPFRDTDPRQSNWQASRSCTLGYHEGEIGSSARMQDRSAMDLSTTGCKKWGSEASRRGMRSKTEEIWEKGCLEVSGGYNDLFADFENNSKAGPGIMLTQTINRSWPPFVNRSMFSTGLMVLVLDYKKCSGSPPPWDWWRHGCP